MSHPLYPYFYLKYLFPPIYLYMYVWKYKCCLPGTDLVITITWTLTLYII